jgi:hypothetical protein
MIQQPEMSIGGVIDMPDENSEVSGKGTLGLLQTVAGAFSAWAERVV